MRVHNLTVEGLRNVQDVVDFSREAKTSAGEDSSSEGSTRILPSESESIHTTALDLPSLESFHYSPIIRVNLLATDNQIRTKFKSWLDAKRQEMPIDGPLLNKFSTKDYSSWVENRVLLYLDLAISLLLEKKRLSYEAQAACVFPDLVFIQKPDPVEKLIRTVLPLARSVIHHHALRALRLEALKTSSVLT